MQKAALGILALLALYFAAANARLADRGRQLEARLAALEKAKPDAALRTHEPAALPIREELPARASAVKPVAPPATAATRLPAAASPPPSGKAAPQDVQGANARAYLGRALAEVQALAADAKHQWMTLKMNPDDAELGLSDHQKGIIDGLRKNRDLQTQPYRNQIQSIEDQTELAIRQVLTPDQQKKYDGQATPQVDLQLTPQVLADDAAPQGPRPGYLGVSALDSGGGGATISQVMPNSAASALGLAAGDVILEVNGQATSSYADLATKIQAAGEGAPVTLKVRRNGTEFYPTGQLGARPK